MQTSADTQKDRLLLAIRLIHAHAETQEQLHEGNAHMRRVMAEIQDKIERHWTRIVITSD